MFRCRIDRLRNLPCRGVHVEGARSQHVAALPRDCSEVKSHAATREGRACRGRTRAGPVRTPRAEGGAGTSRANFEKQTPCLRISARSVLTGRMA